MSCNGSRHRLGQVTARPQSRVRLALQVVPDAIGLRAARYGERFGWDWLTYNPQVMWRYHRFACQDRESVIAAIAAEFPDVARWVDVGAGTGTFAAAVDRRGLDVRGFERSRFGRALGRLQGVAMHHLDFAEPLRLPAGDRFDLAYSFEVAEHLTPEAGDRLVELLVRIAPLILFTAAQPGQGGEGHVNEQPLQYWIHRFEQHGAHHDAQRSLRLSESFQRAGVRSPWLIDNLSVFEAPESCPDRASSDSASRLLTT